MQILILGAKGMLGGALRRVFPNALAWDREEADVTKIENLKLKIENLQIRPTVIISCVAFNDVDRAEASPKTAFKLNTEAPGNLAKLCKDLGIKFVHFSTNYIFDGIEGEYRESDKALPLSVYGQSKYKGELEIVKNTSEYYIVRTAVLFGPKGLSELSKKSFVDLMLDLSAKSDTIKAVKDEISSLTYSEDLASQVKLLLEQKRAYGIYHIVNSRQASWYDFANEIFSLTGKNIKLIPVSSSEFPRQAARPKKSVLLNTKLAPLRPWQEALAEFLNKGI